MTDEEAIKVALDVFWLIPFISICILALLADGGKRDRSGK